MTPRERAAYNAGIEVVHHKLAAGVAARDGFVPDELISPRQQDRPT